MPKNLRGRRLDRASGAALLVALCLGLSPGAASASTSTFVFTGTEQTFTVPAGVTQVHVIAIGAKGGKGTTVAVGGEGGAGGFGARTVGDLAVMPGEKLFIEVGGNGATGAGGFNGGGSGGGGNCAGFGSCPAGGGGGASDLRMCSMSAGSCSAAPNSLASRLIVAAGGGGGGTGNGAPFQGGKGADAGSDGANGGGGGCTGGGGGMAGSSTGGSGGSTGSCIANEGGVSGGFGQGGQNGNQVEFPGGGGGGGYYGGGGGGTGNGSAGGGGGGGSNLALGAANVSMTTDSTGTPLLSITTPSITKPPSNTFSFGTLKLNKKNGTAALSVNTPGRGTVALFGKGIKTEQGSTGAAQSVTLSVIPTRKLKKKLKKTGTAKVSVSITFTPTGGSPNTQSERVKLIKPK